MIREGAMNPREVALLEVTRKCSECGQNMIGRRQNYHYSEVGLDSVTLTNVLVFHCKCGGIVAELPAVGHLHCVIAFDLLRKETILSGEEVRFLRKWVGYSATQLAETTGYSKSIISRWENQKQDIGKEPDRLLRLVIFAKILENATGERPAIEVNGQPTPLAEVGKLVKSLNLPEILRKIEDKHEGSKQLRIPISTPDACLAVQ